jgi:hypothetical protein
MARGIYLHQDEEITPPNPEMKAPKAEFAVRGKEYLGDFS